MKQISFFILMLSLLSGYGFAQATLLSEREDKSQEIVLIKNKVPKPSTRSASPYITGQFSADLASLTLWSPVDSGEAWVTFSADNGNFAEPVEFVDGSATLFLDLPADTEYTIQVEFVTGACYTGTFRL